MGWWSSSCAEGGCAAATSASPAPRCRSSGASSRHFVSGQTGVFGAPGESVDVGSRNPGPAARAGVPSPATSFVELPRRARAVGENGIDDLHGLLHHVSALRATRTLTLVRRTEKIEARLRHGPEEGRVRAVDRRWLTAVFCAGTMRGAKFVVAGRARIDDRRACRGQPRRLLRWRSTTPPTPQTSRFGRPRRPKSWAPPVDVMGGRTSIRMLSVLWAAGLRALAFAHGCSL